MELSLAGFKSEIGAQRDFSFQMDWDALPRMQGLPFDGKCEVNGKVSVVSLEQCAITGQISARLNANCDRCLEDASVTLDFPFEAQARDMRTEQDPEQEMYTFSGDTLDVMPIVQDELLLNLPIQVLCSENCKGLCPVCGVNRNHTQCSCLEAAEREKHPFSALRALIRDDEEV